MCGLITCTCLHRNILCGDYGSGANHCAWSFIVLQFPFISQSSPRATFWLMSTPIQHKINWFHSRRLEMVGNIPPHPPFLAMVCECACVILNQQKIHRRKKTFLFVCLFNKVEGPSASWLDAGFKNYAATCPWVCSMELERWGGSGGRFGAPLLAITRSFQWQERKGRLGVSWAVWQRRGEDPSVNSKLLLPGYLCCSICLFWERRSPTVCSWVSSAPGGIMTETEIFPPVVNGPPLLKPSQKPHPRLPPLHRLVSVNKTGGGKGVGEDASSHLSLMTIFVSKPRVSEEKMMFWFSNGKFLEDLVYWSPSLFV